MPRFGIGTWKKLEEEKCEMIICISIIADITATTSILSRRTFKDSEREISAFFAHVGYFVANLRTFWRTNNRP